MLHRADPDGLIVIAQPAHAWLAGQLARAWGNERFGEVAPWEEVCLGAEQHDIGWLTWEARPTLNPDTGRPHAFTELPRLAHMGIWRDAARTALAQGRYAALLVSLHGSGLYADYDGSGDSPEAARAVREFVAREQTFQEALLASLRGDPRYAPVATPDVVRRNRRLVATLDGMSLALCRGLQGQASLRRVPATRGETSLTLTPVGGDPGRVAVAPWPFREERLTVVCEGRRLPGTFAGEEPMRAALEAAPWVTIAIELRPS